MALFSEVISTVLGALERAGIPYMVVGSFAASLYGVTRTTHDIDIVVALSLDAVPMLSNSLGEGFYLDEEAARGAVSRSDMFNALHVESGLKVDFWILGRDDFSQTQFERRKQTNAWGTGACVASPEDTVLSKLLWHNLSGSERQLSDARDILRAQQGLLDCHYLRRWSSELNIDDLLNQLIEEN